jgi:membrane protease YdiL (CAAX protease family)
LQQELLARLRSPALANTATALVFALAHGLSQGTWQSLLTLLPALVIGLLYQRSRQVAPCIALHSAFNAIWLVWSSTVTFPS